MAIYKLGDLSEINTGKLNADSEAENGKYDFITCSDKIGKCNTWSFDGKYITVSGNGSKIGHTFIHNGKFDAYQRTYVIKANEHLVRHKYLFYLLKMSNNYIKQTSKGSAIPYTTLPILSNIKWNIPSLDEQQKIIDIIEPIEMQEEKINNIILNIKILLINSYNLVNNEGIKFSSILSLINSKYENQKEYFATNAVGEFEVSLNKIQLLEKSVPSRAAVTPPGNSFILSKLDGENKVFYFDTRPHQVFSTGFFNFSTEYIDHISGFLLSNSFKVQKKAYSTGTTMRSITNKSLDEIMIKKPNDKNNHLTKILVKNVMLLEELQKLKEKIIKLLIK